VLEIQVVENLQRDDLTPLEEAEGYEHLMQHTGLSADELGAKVGKSRSYIYAKLKLLDLCQEVKQALRDGTVDASTRPAHRPHPRRQAADSRP
jgi:ParB/RepB/Spo0J family partition protein